MPVPTPGLQPVRYILLPLTGGAVLSAALMICLQLPQRGAFTTGTAPARGVAKSSASGELKLIHAEMDPLVECGAITMSQPSQGQDPAFDFDARFRQASIMRNVRSSQGPDIELASKLTTLVTADDCEPAKHN